MSEHDHAEHVPGCFRCDLSRDEHAARPAGSARDDDGDLTEQIADVLAHWPIGSGYYGTTVPGNDAREMAADILALPAVRAALDAQQAVQRVRALAEQWDRSHDWTDAAFMLRRALDGTTPQ